MKKAYSTIFKNHISIAQIQFKTLDKSLPSFFFFKRPIQNISSSLFNQTIRLNRTITPFNDKLCSYSFWSLNQIEQVLKNRDKDDLFENSLIVNPYKCGKFIKVSLEKNINRMVIQDLEELTKIKRIYQQLFIQNKKICQPTSYWLVDDPDQCFEEIKNFRQHICQDVKGLYFTKQNSVQKCVKFGEQIQKLGLKLNQNYRETTTSEFFQNEQQFRNKNIYPEICDFSEIQEYMMVCRVIGMDKRNNYLLSDQCYDFFCSVEQCQCSKNFKDIIKISGMQWALVQPSRLDQLAKKMII